MGAFRDILTAVDGHCIGLLSGPDAVRYHAGDGEVVSVSGIFDNVYQSASSGFPGVQSSGPSFFCRESSLSSDPRSDTEARLEVDDVFFTLREVQPDNQGGILLLLHLEQS